MEKYRKLLEVYTLEELVEMAGLEQHELLELLDQLGYLKFDIPEAL